MASQEIQTQLKLKQCNKNNAVVIERVNRSFTTAFFVFCK